MKRGAIFFLRGVIGLIGAIVLAICIFLLPVMWRAVPGEYPDHTYVFYCILLAFYLATVPFYIGLYQAVRLLRYIDTNRAFSGLAVRALQIIAYCAGVISVVFVAMLPFVYLWAQAEDAPGLVVMGMLLVVAPLTVAVFAAVLQRLFQEAIAIKSENDLTV